MKTSYDSHNPAAVRKRLLVPKSQLADDSLSVNYVAGSNQLILAHTDSDDDIQQLQADENGVFFHVKEGGAWRTIPQGISRGGTGGTNRQTALQNLGICFSNGSSWNMAAGCALVGYITENGTTLYFDLETPRWMDFTSRITINSFSGVLRGLKGYLDSSNAARNFKASPFSCAATRLSMNRMRLRIIKSSAFTNVDNNTPVSCNATWNFTYNT